MYRVAYLTTNDTAHSGKKKDILEQRIIYNK